MGSIFGDRNYYFQQIIVSYDEVALCIEGTFSITENDRVTTMKRGGDAEKLQQLCRLSFQKISAVRLTAPNNLCLLFESGMQLDVCGENDHFEGWQLEARVDEEMILIVAGPHESLTLFE